MRNTADQPFQPGHTYAVFMTTGLKSATGAPAAADADFTAVMGGDAADGRRARPRLGRVPAAAQLADEQGRRRARRSATAAVFTVQDAPGHMARLAASVATQPRAGADRAHAVRPGRDLAVRRRHAGARLPGRRAPTFAEIHGKFSVPIYQTGTAPYETPAQGGGIVGDRRRCPRWCAPSRSASR